MGLAGSNSTSRPGSGELGVEDLLTLVDVSRALASEVHLPRLLHRILTEANRLTDSPSAAVLLLDEERGSLYFADALGDAAPMLLSQWGKGCERMVPLVGSKAGQVFTGMRSIVTDAIAVDPNHFKGVDQATAARTESMVCVPLVAAGRTPADARALGVIQILNKRSGNYTERDRVLLERFADQAAVAIVNAQLVSDLFANKGLYAADDDTDPVEILARSAWFERLSVLLADMRGFTQLCQMTARPERLQEMLNEFLGLLAQCVIANHGVVNKFLGDGLMALFRKREHAERAVQCAFDMLSGFDAMKQRWDDDNNQRLAFLDLGIGISTEEVILGVVGTKRVWDFTAVGTGTNLAAHLMEEARNGRRLLVDKVTFRAAQKLVDAFDGPEAFELRKPGQSVAHPYERYVLRSRKGDAVSAMPKVSQRSGCVFISYSHIDEPWRLLLRTHLEPYVSAGSVEVWDDTAIEAGSDWKLAIESAIGRASVALFMVSPNLLASPFVRDEEMRPLLARARQRDVKVLWMPLMASSYEETAFGGIQAAMNPSNPLDRMSSPDQHHALVRLCKLIKSAI